MVRCVSASLGSDDGLARLQADLAAEAAADRRRQMEAAARSVMDATRGLGMGERASPEAASRVAAAVAAFEDACPCTLSGDRLLLALGGEWELVYSDALLAGSSGGGQRGSCS